ncbi:MAG: efflux RND transporter periplasmic adaptor subunit [Gemmatimonadales bacterium]|nr:efflux RND transporter periplasmic adaptor subunit [Gemmatimonadales bacterium]
MTGAAHDLSRLKINRDAPPAGVRRAFRTTLILAAVAMVVVTGAVLVIRRGSTVPVQVVTATLSGGGASAGAGRGVSVVANGYVVARTKASVAAKIPGRLAFLGVSEGSNVRGGQIIARLENAEYTASVAEAEANLATARATLIEAESDRDQLQREARRARDLRTQNPNLVSQQDVEGAESRAAQAEARFRAQASRVHASEAGLRLAQASLDNTVIRAPFTGTVLRKEAEVGEVVAPSVGGGLTRGAVVTMADLRTLEVEVDVNEAYIARVRSGQDARITLDAYPDTAFRGTARQVVPTADRQRATVQVKVSILDHDPRILPEMGARVEFLEDAVTAEAARAAPPRVVVPAAAVRAEGGKTVVWLVRQGRIETHEVQAGPVSGGLREIRSGLAGGEVIVVGGPEGLRAGQRVTIEPLAGSR